MKSVNGSFHEVSCFQFILVFQHKVLLLPHRLLSTASCRLHFSPFTAHRLSSPANPLSPSLTQYIHHATLILLLDHISHTTTTTSTTPECPAQSNTHHAPALLLPDHFHQRLGNMVLHSISGHPTISSYTTPCRSNHPHPHPHPHPRLHYPMHPTRRHNHESRSASTRSNLTTPMRHY